MAGGYGLGVDLGTTYTAAALWRDGRAECVPLGTSTMSVPSVLFLREDDVLLVGDAAVRRGIAEPDRVARQFKRRFGDDVPMVLGDLEVGPAELAGQLLRWVVDTVTEREGAPPAHVTLTHPATWREHRTALLVEAAETAGLIGVGLLAEPVAAAAFYASTERLGTGALLAVYDLGGGTFDATVVRKTATGFAVQGPPMGDPDIGGTDFDQVVLDHVASVLGVAWRTLDLDDPAVLAAVAQVREHAVAAKEQLSSDTEASVPVVLPGVVRDVRITRGEFESAIRIPVLRTLDVLTEAIDAAGVTPADIRTALLVGGSSRVPLISRLVSSQLGLDVGIDAHPKYAVCLGAAISAGARLEAGGVAAAPPPVPAQPPPPTPETTTGPAAHRRTPAPEPADDWQWPTEGDEELAPSIVPDERAATQAPEWSPAAENAASGTAASGTAADLPAPEAEPLSVEVDLVSTGITAAVDAPVRTAPAPMRWTPVLAARDEALTGVHTGDRRRGVRTAAIAALLTVALVVTLILLGTAGRAETAVPAGPASTSGTTP
jgi:molecular chaperone DnaK